MIHHSGKGPLIVTYEVHEFQYNFQSNHGHSGSKVLREHVGSLPFLSAMSAIIVYNNIVLILNFGVVRSWHFWRHLRIYGSPQVAQAIFWETYCSTEPMTYLASL